MQLSDIRNQALAMVRDHAGDVASPVEVTALINRGQLEFVNRTNYLRNTVLIDCVSSQSIYNLPGDVLEVLRVALGEQVLAPVSWRELDGFRSLWRNDTGTPTNYLRDIAGASTIRLYPIPTANGQSLMSSGYQFNQETGSIAAIGYTPVNFNQEPGVIRTIIGYGIGDVVNTLRVDYVQFPATLVNDTDVPAVSVQFHDCLSSYAAGHVLNRNGQSDRAQVFLAEFENQVGKATREAASAFQKSITRSVPYTSF